MECSADGLHCVKAGEDNPRQKLARLEAKDADGQCEPGFMCPGGCCPEKCWYCCLEMYCAATMYDCAYSVDFI